MADAKTVPVIAPDGSVGDIPVENLAGALKDGGRLGVNVQAPDGTVGVVPHENADAAVKDGGKVLDDMLPKKEEPKGFLGQLGDRIKSDAQAVSDTPGVLGKLQTAAGKAVDAYNDVQTGAFKGAGSTGYNLANLTNKGLRFLENHSPGVTPEQVDKVIPAMNPELPEFLKPSNPVQSIGKGAEQTAEFFIPGGAVAKGEKAVDAAAQLSKLPSFLQKAAAVTGKAALEGTANAGVATAQGGDALPAFLIGAGGKAIGEGASAAAPFLKKSAQTTYAKFLNPTKETTKFEASNVVPELLDRRQIALTGQGLEDKAAGKLSDIGAKIDTAVQSVPKSVQPDVQSVLDSIDNYKNSHLVNGVAVGSKAESAVANADRVKNTIMDIVTSPGGDVSYQSLNKARQILDKSVAQSGAYAGKTLSEGTGLEADKAAANAIRSELSKNSPDIAKLNKEFHFWAQVKDVIGQTNERRVGQQGGLGRIFAPLAGASAGLAHGGMTTGGAFDAAAYSAALLAVNEAVRSPAFKTTAAVIKNDLANSLAKGQFKQAVQIASRIAASRASRNTSTDSTRTPSPSQTAQPSQ